MLAGLAQPEVGEAVEAVGVPSPEVLRGVAAAAEAEVAGPKAEELAAKLPVRAVHRQRMQSLHVSASLNERAG